MAARLPGPALAWALSPLVLLLAFLAVGPLLTPFDVITPDWGVAWQAPELASAHPLGTDAIGRDVLARTVLGGRWSLLVALTSAFAGALFGAIYGALCGFAGGWIDVLGMRLVDALTGVPLLLVAVVVITVLDPGMLTLVLVIASYLWLDVARLLRAETVRLRQREFLLAARLAGISRWRRFAHHLTPHLLGPWLLALTLAVPHAVLIESFLSFLGLGPGEAVGSLGSLLAEGAQDLELAPWLLLAPTAVLLLLLGGLRALALQLEQRLQERA